MKISELVREVAKEAKDFSQKEISMVFQALTKVIERCIEEEKEIPIPHIGKLKMKHKNARVVRKIKTGELVHIPAKKVPTFVISKKFKNGHSKVVE